MDVESPEKIGGSRIYVELFSGDIPWLIWVVVSSLKRYLDFRFLELNYPLPIVVLTDCCVRDAVDWWVLIIN